MLLRFLKQWRRHGKAQGTRQRRRSRPRLEALEDRQAPAVFLVTDTFDAGPGSLRQAILDSNATPGPNTIDFDILGPGVQTILVGSTTGAPLPAITNPVTVAGYSQPVSGGAADLVGDGQGACLSPALGTLQGNSDKQFPVALIAGQMSPTQLASLDNSVKTTGASLLTHLNACASDYALKNYNSAGWLTLNRTSAAYLSDAIVPVTSALANTLSCRPLGIWKTGSSDSGPPPPSGRRHLVMSTVADSQRPCGNPVSAR